MLLSEKVNELITKLFRQFHVSFVRVTKS